MTAPTLQVRYDALKAELSALNKPMECGHPARYLLTNTNGNPAACVACLANEAIRLGVKQADEVDRFWEAMGVNAADITVDQAIAKWQSMEKVLHAAKGIFTATPGMPAYSVFDNRIDDMVKLQEALREYDAQPKVESEGDQS